jgi:long-subunit acyl-CoA synthetase (AMP-forming)
LSLEIKKALKNQPNKHQKINLVCPNDISYIVGQWAIWMSGNIVVPISGQHTDNALEYFMNDSESSLVISSPELMHKVRQNSPENAQNRQKSAKMAKKENENQNIGKIA